MASSNGRKEGLSRHIAKFAAQTRFEDLSPRAVEMAKYALLDAIGVSLGASGMSQDVEPFVELALAQGGAEQASIIGHGQRVSAEQAAFANGAMAHALDFEDTFDRSPCHPNASLVPAVLAICQRDRGIDGKGLLTAMAIGCDLVCRVALSFEQAMEESGWYPPPILGGIGAVAAAGWLKGLTPSQMTDAFSLMLCQITCSGEIKYSPEAVIRAVREAFPARAAVTCVDLAARGVSGFDAPFEGEAGFFRLYVDGHYDAGTITAGLGEYFHGEELSFKVWPSCRGTHAYIEACLELLKKHQIDWRDVGGLRLTGGEVHAMLVHPRAQKVAPRTLIDAKFSLPFTVATALRDGGVTLGSFTPAALEDAEILSLAERVTLDVSSNWTRQRAAAGRVDIQLRSGEHLSAEVEQALGHPANPVAQAQLVDKFCDCAGRARRPMSANAARAAAERLLHIDSAPDVAVLFDEIL